MDGVILVDGAGDEARYIINDLAQQNAGAPNPSTATIDYADDENLAMLTRLANCFKEHDDADSGVTVSAQESIRNYFVRPNEVYMVPANRADVFFQAPTDIVAPFPLPSFDGAAHLPATGSENVSQGLLVAFADNDITLASNAQASVIATTGSGNDLTAILWRIDDPFAGDPSIDVGSTYLITQSGGQGDAEPSYEAAEVKIYTLLAKSSLLAGDTYQQSLQKAVASGKGNFQAPPQDIVVAHLVVTGAPAVGEDGNPFDVMSLIDVLPDVAPYHQPIEDEELQIAQAEAVARADVDAGSFRTRTVTYSGWGAQDYPLITTHSSDAFAALGYDAARLLLTAIDRAGSADPEAVRTALSGIRDFDGVTGQLGYHAGSRIPVKSVTILGVEAGTYKLVAERMPDRVPQPQ